MKEEKLEPELRFPEFNSNWEIKKLGKVFEMKAGSFISASKIVDESNPNLYPCYGGNGLRGYTESCTHQGKYNLIGRQGALCGNIKLVEGAFHATEHAVVVENNETQDIDFIFYVLNKANLNRLATGQAQPGLSISTLNSVKFYTTSLPEQQKIASFLSAIDQRIQLLEQKKESLERYKKGVMQKLFAQEIRFKDDQGNEFPDWEEKRLKDISIKVSSNISANELDNINGDYKIYGATGLLKKVDFYKEESAYVSIVKDGAGVGRLLLCDPQSSVLGTLDIIKPKGGNDLRFLFYTLQSIRFDKYITGSTIPHIYFKDYSKSKILVPCLNEQLKISSFLSQVQSTIDLIGDSIDSTSSFKKGLLQKMFV